MQGGSRVFSGVGLGKVMGSPKNSENIQFCDVICVENVNGHLIS